jgi:hypothetical protein
MAGKRGSFELSPSSFPGLRAPPCFRVRWDRGALNRRAGCLHLLFGRGNRICALFRATARRPFLRSEWRNCPQGQPPRPMATGDRPWARGAVHLVSETPIVSKCSQPFGSAILWLHWARLGRMRISDGIYQNQNGGDIIAQAAALS